MPLLIRSASLTDYAALASFFGLDPLRMMSRAGIPRASLTDPDIKIRANSVARLLEISAKAANVDDFGLRLAEKRLLSNLGPIGLIVREQPTVRKALDALIRYGPLQNEALRLRLVETDGQVVVSPEILFRRPLPVSQGVQLIIGVVYRTLRTLLGGAWKSRAVCFSQSPTKSPETFRRMFGTSVRFNSDFNGIVCAATDLELPIPSSDPVMARYVERYLDSIAGRPNLSMSEKVRESIAMMLAAGNCSIARVAEQLGVDRRTVHRRLAQEGETFSSILDAVRTEMMTRFVENKDKPLYQVAELLGFSGLSALSRWFKARFGCSISDWRARNIRGSRRRVVPLRPAPLIRRRNPLVEKLVRPRAVIRR